MLLEEYEQWGILIFYLYLLSFFFFFSLENKKKILIGLEN